MIQITFKNGTQARWGKGQYADFKYDGKCFIVIGAGQELSIFNIDTISSATVSETGEEKEDS